MMSGKRLHYALLLCVIFIIGLSLGYISRLNQVPSVHIFRLEFLLYGHVLEGPNIFALHYRDVTDGVLPTVNSWSPAEGGALNSGVVYDCVTWEALYEYDIAEVAKNYQTFPDIRGEAGETDDHRQNAFIEIYNRQTWYGRKINDVAKTDVNYKASGPGSALEWSQGVMAVYHTMINRLRRELDKTSIKILDLPCGDLQYMSYFLRTRDDIDYTGADIVPDLIQKHTEHYKGRNNFKNLDIVKNVLNDSYDLIICRMMLQHLTNKEVLRTLYHLSSSNSMYLAATTFSNNKVNQELPSTSGGRFRVLNLEKPPISLSPPICTYSEPIITDHFMAIWKLPLLQQI